MHGLSYCNNLSRILALDLGKFNSVLCVYDPATNVHRFESLQTTPRTVHDMLVEQQTPDPAQTLLVVETCDVAGWVHDVARRHWACVSRSPIPVTKRGAGHA